MTAIAKSAKTHPAAKKCCGWEEPYWSQPYDFDKQIFLLKNLLVISSSDVINYML